jgi:hypothetical protein
LPLIASSLYEQLQFKRLAQQQLLYQMALATQAAAAPSGAHGGAHGGGMGAYLDDDEEEAMYATYDLGGARGGYGHCH